MGVSGYVGKKAKAVAHVSNLRLCRQPFRLVPDLARSRRERTGGADFSPQEDWEAKGTRDLQAPISSAVFLRDKSRAPGCPWYAR